MPDGLQNISDRAHLRARADPEHVRADTVAALQATLEEGRRAAEARLLAEGDGLDCARSLSDLMDGVVRAAYDSVVRHLYPSDNPSSGEKLAVVATGGYGRGAMAPGSDVDLLFLLPYKQTAWGESVVEAMLYIFWDLKLKVGHATRSIDDCVREAKADMTIRTSLLETRFLFGDRALFDDMVARFDRQVVQGTAPDFVEAKLKERDARLSKSGDSRYLVEPNVKDGKGGLRDLNTLFWIAKYVYRVHEPKELVAAGLFTVEECRLFARCEEFLWRVRCHLHFITGRAEERLSFDLQRQVAARIGIAGRKAQSSVERFMKHYFLVAKDVGDLTAIVCAALEGAHAKPRPVLDRMLSRLRWRSNALDDANFVLDNERINLSDPEAFRRDPVNLIRLFHLADRQRRAIHPDATRLARRSLKLITEQLRRDPEANRLFLEILTSKNSPEVVLRRMNEAGVLGRFVPDFGRVVAMIQFNMYHHYTVDEHLLRTIGALAEIDAKRMEHAHPLANRVVHSIKNRRALYVAVFLHDIAKGRVEDHSIAGARIARKLGPRFGLDAGETDHAAWLVEHHLLMSTVAQSRDLSDPETIKGFATIVQTVERLKLLLVLTIADIKAVGPGVWTGWKGELLRTLYYETEVVLTGGHSDKARLDRVGTAQAQLRVDLADWAEPKIEAYAQRHYPAYWLKTEPKRRIRHARFLDAAEAEGRTVATAVETDAFVGVTELTVLSPDHPRLLAIVTGACAGAGGNIVDAHIFTTADGMALDTIFLSRAFERDEDEFRRGERVASAIERALKGELRIADLVDTKRRPRQRQRTFHVVPEVIIDNSLSSRHTVVQVSGLDRPGLLYDLTTALGRLNLNIASAHVATFGEKAVDVFYVTDLTGTKVTHAGRGSIIRRSLVEVLASEAGSRETARPPTERGGTA